MTMKNGFSTLNRLLGKQKEPNTNLSKSSTNLSVTKSSLDIRDSSQMHQNRITPLPIATSNAPFEQTFRITVLLPRDQLYVARLGAKVLLHKLLQLVCENKQLDVDKYEFQHPADPSQVFSCDLTIGAVGLSEIRLCNKSETSNTFHHTNEVVKLRRKSSERNSFSSSQFSRNSKNIVNTPSPYSSRNSLSSMNSSGINSNYAEPVVKPPRKKRLAPKPPSKTSTQENEAPQQKTSDYKVSTPDNEKPEKSVFDSKSFRESNISIDLNGNTKGSLKINENGVGKTTHQQEGIKEDYIETSTVSDSNGKVETISKVVDTAYNNNGNISTTKSSITQPEPSPRKKVPTKARKSIPMPPPRSLHPPAESLKETITDEKMLTTIQICPVALPRSSPETLIQDSDEVSAVNSKNVSKTIVNGSSTVEAEQVQTRQTSVEITNLQSNQSDTVIEEPLYSAWSPSSPENLQTNCKAPLESSSDDDEIVNVYDLKLGKTIVKTLSEEKPFAVSSIDQSKETNLGVDVNLGLQKDQAITPAEAGVVKTEELSNLTILTLPSLDDINKKDDFPGISITTKTKEHSLSELRLECTNDTPVAFPESLELNDKEQRQQQSVIEEKLEEKQTTKKTEEKVVELKQEPELKTTSEIDLLRRHLDEAGEQKEKTISKDKELNRYPDKTVEEETKTTPKTQTLIKDSAETKEQEDKKSSNNQILFTDPDEAGKQEEQTSSKLIELLIRDPDETGKQEQQITSNNQILIRDPEQAGKQEEKTSSKLIELLIRDPDETRKQEEQITSNTEILIRDPNEAGHPDKPEKRNPETSNAMGTISSSTEEINKQKPLLSTLERLIDTDELQDDENSKTTKIYRKSSSITLISNVPRRRCSISRLDSFHSTQQKRDMENTNNFGLASRSTSFLSLGQFDFENQQNLLTGENFSRRRSSSELSIGESPSLQSLQVIKSILNSRKNSVTSLSSTEEPKTPPTKCDIQLMEQTSPKSNILARTKFSTGEEKVYRYSGPPNINLSTWSERPKVKVLIKNEHASISEGSVSSSQNTRNKDTVDEGQHRNFSVLKNGELITSAKETTSNQTFKKELTYQRNSLPASAPPTTTKPKFLFGARKPNPRPETLASQTVGVVSSIPQNSGSTSFTFLRPTSMTQANSKPVIDLTQQPAFGQVTLRKTGFKDKILSSDTIVDDSKPTVQNFKIQGNSKTELKTSKTYISQPKIHTEPLPLKKIPAAPPPPIIRAVVTKQKTNILLEPAANPRDQLLLAIRNFKRDELKNLNDDE